MHIYYHTFGCKVNSYETENILQNMELNGHQTVSKIEDAQVCIINSCTVTHEADKKLHQLINKIRRVNPNAIIILAGCYSQVAKDAKVLADICIGTQGKTLIPKMLDEYIANKAHKWAVKSHFKGEDFEPMCNHGNPRKTRAEIKIQDGCDRFCTYCIIPYARGRARSKSLSDIEYEAKQLVNDGHKEICLVGINLSCYGHDIGINLADAVETVCNTSGAERVRLGSLEAELLDVSIIERLSRCKTLCPHFHLSLQSGCNKTLKDMGRKYDKEEYFTIVDNIRRYFPDCAITTDVMVGFPGETETDFNESFEFVRTVKFADGHVFPYSPRESTVASMRADQISREIKAARAKAMADEIDQSRKEFLSSMVGKTFSVLFEKEKDKSFHIGHTGNYTVVKVKAFTQTLRYEIRSVMITSTDGNVCYGEIV